MYYWRGAVANILNQNDKKYIFENTLPFNLPQSVFIFTFSFHRETPPHFPFPIYLLPMIRFQDIMTSDIVYYDKRYPEECQAFCKARVIQYLPSIHDSKVAFKFTEAGKFDQFGLKAEYCVHPREALFRKNILAKFKKHQVLFVMEQDTLHGVVHFSDFNRPAVYEEIYKKLYKLERGLTHLLIQYGGQSLKTLEDFCEKKIDNPDKEGLLDEADLRKLNMGLWKLLTFINRIDLLKISRQDIHRIKEVRNKIAHSDDLVAMVSYQNNSLEYRYNSFKELIEGVVALDVAIRQVANRIYLMKAYTEDDFTQRVGHVHEEVFE